MAKAMVKPRPKRPDQHGKLKWILEEYGNDRAYTIIRSSPNKWVIQFEGDTVPMIVFFEGDKPVIMQKGPKD